MEQRLKITFVLPPDQLVGGIRVAAEYAERLYRRGHDVLVVQPQHRSPTWRDVARSIKNGCGWPARRGEGPSYFDALTVPRVVLNHEGPVTALDVPEGDIVVATWWETAEWVWSLPMSKGAKVHFMQDYETWSNQSARVDATCALPIPKIVIAHWVESLLKEKFQQTALALVPNSVDTSKFTAPPRGKQRTPTVGLTYSTMHSKGTDISLEAVKIAREQVGELKLVAFGSVKPWGQLPLPENTTYHERVPDTELPGIYASCDAWLFGTRREGFGLPVLEAMACRTPVIGAPAGAAPELLRQGGGWLVPAESPAAMAEAIVRLSQMSDEAWRCMSDLAYATAHRYTWDDATDRFEAALRQATLMEMVAGDSAYQGAA